MSCDKCNCEKCLAERTRANMPVDRPHRCDQCGTIQYLWRIEDGQWTCFECGGNLNFAGFESWEGIPTKSTQMYDPVNQIHEDHNWQERGMLNPHALPQRNSPMYEKYMREGKIRKDRLGRDCLVSENKQDYVRQMKDLGYMNNDGEGEINRSRQRGEHLG